MQANIDISWLQLGLFGIILIIPLSINAYLKLGLTKSTLISLIRMILQLGLLGLYLEYIFVLDNLWVNLIWILVMLIIGSHSIINKTELPHGSLFIINIFALSCALIPLLFFLLAIVIKPMPLYNAQYMIPLAGMLLGSSLSSNIVALQTLFDAFIQRESEYEAALALGATPYQAAFPFLQQAIKKAQAPMLASMATMGIVTLPGMMTGQILGGITPMIAIKYQLLILTAIFVMLTISLTIMLILCLRYLLDKNGLIKIKKVLNKAIS
jgi:putative ABC transport system permease protein